MIVQSGLGSVPTSSIISSGVATVGGAGAAAAATTAGAAFLATLGISASFIPFIGPIIGGIALAISALGVGNGCGQTCIIASQDADKIEPLMAQNFGAAQQQAVANGGCLTSSQQKAALQNFDDLWGALFNACSDPNLADAGKRCISERQRGGKYDYFAAHRDPISAIPVCSGGSSIAASIGEINPLYLAGGAGLLLLLVLGSD